MLYSNCNYTIPMYSLNFFEHSPLDLNSTPTPFSKNYHLKYFAPPMDVVLIGPHKFECIIYKGLVARIPTSPGNATRCGLSSMFASQTNKKVGQIILPRFMPFTML